MIKAHSCLDSSGKWKPFYHTLYSSEVLGSLWGSSSEDNCFSVRNMSYCDMTRCSFHGYVKTSADVNVAGLCPLWGNFIVNCGSWQPDLQGPMWSRRISTPYLTCVNILANMQVCKTFEVFLHQTKCSAPQAMPRQSSYRRRERIGGFTGKKGIVNVSPPCSHPWSNAKISFEHGAHPGRCAGTGTECFPHRDKGCVRFGHISISAAWGLQTVKTEATALTWAVFVPLWLQMPTAQTALSALITFRWQREEDISRAWSIWPVLETCLRMRWTAS